MTFWYTYIFPCNICFEGLSSEVATSRILTVSILCVKADSLKVFLFFIVFYFELLTFIVSCFSPQALRFYFISSWILSLMLSNVSMWGRLALAFIL